MLAGSAVSKSASRSASRKTDLKFSYTPGFIIKLKVLNMRYQNPSSCMYYSTYLLYDNLIISIIYRTLSNCTIKGSSVK